MLLSLEEVEYQGAKPGVVEDGRGTVWSVALLEHMVPLFLAFYLPSDARIEDCRSHSVLLAHDLHNHGKQEPTASTSLEYCETLGRSERSV